MQWCVANLSLFMQLFAYIRINRYICPSFYSLFYEYSGTRFTHRLATNFTKFITVHFIQQINNTYSIFQATLILNYDGKRQELLRFSVAFDFGVFHRCFPSRKRISHCKQWFQEQKNKNKIKGIRACDESNLRAIPSRQRCHKLLPAKYPLSTRGQRFHYPHYPLPAKSCGQPTRNTPKRKPFFHNVLVKRSGKC